jgi:hypothetical protein
LLLKRPNMLPRGKVRLLLLLSSLSSSQSFILGAFAKQLRKATVSFMISFIMSVCLPDRLRGKTRLPPDGFSWNSGLRIFTKICRHIPVLVTVGKKWRTCDVKTYVRLWLSWWQGHRFMVIMVTEIPTVTVVALIAKVTSMSVVTMATSVFVRLLLPLGFT